MSFPIFFSALILTNTIFHYVTSQLPLHEYVVRKDYFTALKAAEFSVDDISEKYVYYRIESIYSFKQSLQVLSYPSKQEIGWLSEKLNQLAYNAQFSVLDFKTKRWMNGIIEQNDQWFGSSFQINLNGRNMSMRTEHLSLTTNYLDTDGRLLMQFTLRPASIFIPKKYDMKVFSNKYPEQIYFLGLAVQHHYDTRPR